MSYTLNKFNKKIAIKCSWITKGILKSINIKDQLIKEMIQSPSTYPNCETLKKILKTLKKYHKKNNYNACQTSLFK